jgi:hypothetical protein
MWRSSLALPRKDAEDPGCMYGWKMRQRKGYEPVVVGLRLLYTHYTEAVVRGRAAPMPVVLGFKIVRSSMSLHTEKRMGQAAPADCVVSAEYPQHSQKVIQDCLSQQISGLI